MNVAAKLLQTIGLAKHTIRAFVRDVHGKQRRARGPEASMHASVAVASLPAREPQQSAAGTTTPAEGKRGHDQGSEVSVHAPVVVARSPAKLSHSLATAAIASAARVHEKIKVRPDGRGPMGPEASMWAGPPPTATVAQPRRDRQSRTPQRRGR